MNQIFVDLPVYVQNELFFRKIIDLLKHIIFIGKPELPWSQLRLIDCNVGRFKYNFMYPHWCVTAVLKTFGTVIRKHGRLPVVRCTEWNSYTYTHWRNWFMDMTVVLYLLLKLITAPYQHVLFELENRHLCNNLGKLFSELQIFVWNRKLIFLIL